MWVNLFSSVVWKHNFWLVPVFPKRTIIQDSATCVTHLDFRKNLEDLDIRSSKLVRRVLIAEYNRCVESL